MATLKNIKQGTEKIIYLDGVRGVAALNVLLTHLIVAFYPALYTGNPAKVHIKVFDEVYFANSAWSVFFAGNMAVPLLFILSAFVLSIPFFRYKDPMLATAGAYRRYLRLEAPVLISVLFAFLLLYAGAVYSHQAAEVTGSDWLAGFFQFAPSFSGALKQGLWECFSPSGAVHYNPVLWTMNYELIGSFSVFGFMALFGRTRARYVVYLAMAMVFVRSYYFAFVIGMFLCDLQFSSKGRQVRNYMQTHSWISWVCLLIGCIPNLYFGNDRSFFDALLNIQLLKDMEIDLFAFYHITGSAFLFFAILYNTTLQKILMLPVIQYFGRIAFSLYLLHLLILCSAGAFVFVSLLAAGYSYGAGTAGAATVTVILSVAAAHLMTVFVDEPATRIVRNFQKKYLR